MLTAYNRSKQKTTWNHLISKKRLISEQTFASGLTQRSVSQARSRILCAEMFCLLFLGSWGLGQVNSQISSEGYMMHTPWRFELLNLRFASQTGSLLLWACWHNIIYNVWANSVRLSFFLCTLNYKTRIQHILEITASRLVPAQQSKREIFSTTFSR